MYITHIYDVADNKQTESSAVMCLNHPAAVAGIPIFGGLAAIFGGLEFAGLLYLTCFSGKSPGYASLKSGHHTSVHCSGIGPASSCIYPQNIHIITPLPLSRR